MFDFFLRVEPKTQFSSWASYLENFSSNYFKISLDIKHRFQGRIMAVPKEPLVLVHFRSLSIQTRSKLRKSFKDILKFLQIKDCI